MSIVVWIAAVVLYLLVGLSICQINREVRKNWEKWRLEQAPKLFVFLPASVINNILGNWERTVDRNSFRYNLLLLLLWPFRIFLLPIVILGFYLAVGWIWIICAVVKKVVPLLSKSLKTLSGYFSEKPEST